MDNFGLVEYSKKWLNYNTRYGWGCWGQPITSAIISQKAQQYPSHYDWNRRQELNSLINNGYLVDCIGLIKGYYWGQTPGSGIVLYGRGDVDADSMLNMASVKGRIGTIPEIPGICVWMRGHIGVYIGEGKTIESTHSAMGDGVVQHNLSGRTWSYWLQCPYIEYKEVKNVSTGNNPSSWAKEHTDWCIAKGLMNGDGQGNYGWQEPLTREQLATIIHSVLVKYGLDK